MIRVAMSTRLAKHRTLALACLIILVALIWLPSIPSHAQSQPQVDLSGKNVLILHAFERTTPTNEATDQGLRESLDAGGISSKNQFFEYLELVRTPGPEYRKRLAELMRLRYSQIKIDMVITLYNEALQFLLNEGRDIFPDVPVLALYRSPGIELPKTNRRIIEHQVTYDISGTLEIALKLVPRAKRVYIVGGVYSSDKRLQNQGRRDLNKWEGSLDFQYLSDMSLEQTLTAVSSLPADSIILFTAFMLDSTGKSYTSRHIAQRISRVSSAPVFGLYDVLLGHGITGGSLVSFQLIGTRAGGLALDILKGAARSGDIQTVLNVPSVPMFDWRQLRRWKLSEAALPKGSIVINREVTFWDFKYYIIGGLTLCLLEAALIIIFIVQRRRKKVAEEELAEAKKHLEAHIVNSPLAIVEFDPQFRVIRWSRVAEQMFGWTAPEVAGRSITELPWVHEDDMESVHRVATDMLKGKSPSNMSINRNYRKDGSIVQCEWYNSAIYDEQGRLISILSRVLDITSRKRAEQEAFDARRELLRMERRLRMGELSASLAHELNQPLTAILSNARAALRFLEAGKLHPGELKEILQDIVNDDKRAGTVIGNLRAMLKPSEEQKEPVPVGTVLQETVGLFNSEAVIRNLQIEIDVADPLPLVYINKVQIQQVLINLMMNAAESMTSDESAKRLILIRAIMPRDDVVQVTVRDFGFGIEEQDLQKIFEPFFTMKSTGLGMGLSLSRSIIESHGGHIWAQNNPDKGATFYFDLPVTGTH